MSDIVTKQIIKELLDTGRLVSAGSLTLDGEVIYQNKPQSGNADEFGFLPPETDFGGQQNEKVNELREEWKNSGDQFKRAAVKNVPHLFVAFTNHYNPSRNTEDWLRMWYNNNRYFMFSGNDSRLFPLVDKSGKIIDNHLFVALRNGTWPDSELHDDMMSGIVNYYRFILNERYEFEKFGGLGRR